MAERQEEATKEEILALAEKLRSFGESLSEKERMLLGHILSRAAAASDEVGGYAFQDPLVDSGISDVNERIVRAAGFDDGSDKGFIIYGRGWPR